MSSSSVYRADAGIRSRLHAVGLVPTVTARRFLRAAVAGAVATSLLSACHGAPSSESEQAVRELWSAYLAAPRSAPSPQWSPAEQKRWPLYDLAGVFLPHGAVPEVLAVTPLDAAADTAYRIVTRFWEAESAARDSSAEPVLTMTVYARRERRRWVLAGALPYHTRGWARETRGRISYVIAPGLQFNAERATRAAAFVDSLATALDVPAPPRIEYYVTESVDQSMEILGAVTPQRYGPNGGFARPTNAQVFSGIPTLGEDYRHELTHVLLAPLISGGSSTLIASEGVPTWFGGSGGRDYEGAVRVMAELLRGQPSIDLNKICFDQSVSAEIRNAAGAVLTGMLLEAGGVAAVREFLQASAAALPATLERQLGMPWDTMEREWQLRVRRIASSAP